ncbi:aminotransferase class V-fold PLP-dependent enzyme [Breznakiellaceae bacterium SP9]
MIHEAIILGAGLGSRLKEHTLAIPKGFLEFNGKAIVERSIQKLLALGIEHIVIGTGHCHEKYDELAKKYTAVQTILNARFAFTGSMGTLELCVPHVTGAVLLLESDLIYDAIGITALNNDYHENAILASGTTHFGDELFLEAVKGYLQRLSKNKNELSSVYGEFVGISKLTSALLTAMCAYAKANEKSLPKLEYVQALAACADVHPVFVNKIKYYTWMKIDTEAHLKTANIEILPHIIENELLRTIRRPVLLNPGPATTKDSVKYAQVVPDICHREKEFTALMAWTSRELTGFVASPDEYETVLFSGSGTAANEVLLSSCVPDAGRLLIVDNGSDGERLTQIAGVYALDADIFKCGPNDPFDAEILEKLEATIAGGNYTHLSIVYHETSTGQLNPLEIVCPLAKKYNIVTIVNAVSAYAGIPMDLAALQIDFMSASSDELIGGMAGLCFVICKKTELERTKTIPLRNLYLNLYDQYDFFAKQQRSRFTPPIQTIYALRQAILETKQETIAARYRRYTECWEILSAAIERFHLQMLIPAAHQSHLLTAILNVDHPTHNYEALYNHCRTFGFNIYPGKLDSADTFRVANTGDIQIHDMLRFTDVLGSYLDGIGWKY